ncbi:MAG: hypothetical protein IT175_05210 [Acidobacteria bacterium]|nr:hypothetical protein [Acidobacteriota bacterium]
MTDFVRRERLYDDIPRQLTNHVPGFKSSSSFRLVEGSADLPSVVVGALAEYLLETYRRMMHSKSASKELLLIVDAVCHEVETLANCREPDARNSVVVDFLESILESADDMPGIEQHFGRSTRRLFDKLLSTNLQEAEE